MHVLVAGVIIFRMRRYLGAAERYALELSRTSLKLTLER